MNIKQSYKPVICILCLVLFCLPGTMADPTFVLNQNTESANPYDIQEIDFDIEVLAPEDCNNFSITDVITNDACVALLYECNNKEQMLYWQEMKQDGKKFSCNLPYEEVYEKGFVGRSIQNLGHLMGLAGPPRKVMLHSKFSRFNTPDNILLSHFGRGKIIYTNINAISKEQSAVDLPMFHMVINQIDKDNVIVRDIPRSIWKTRLYLFNLSKRTIDSEINLSNTIDAGSSSVTWYVNGEHYILFSEVPREENNQLSFRLLNTNPLTEISKISVPMQNIRYAAFCNRDENSETMYVNVDTPPYIYTLNVDKDTEATLKFAPITNNPTFNFCTRFWVSYFNDYLIYVSQEDKSEYYMNYWDIKENNLYKIGLNNVIEYVHDDLCRCNVMSDGRVFFWKEQPNIPLILLTPHFPIRTTSTVEPKEQIQN